MGLIEKRESLEAEIEKVITKFNGHRENLIPALQEIQRRFGYLPEQAMQKLASALNIPEVDVYGVATFYNQFRLQAPGRHQIKVCMGTACHMVGGHIILDCFERRLGIRQGETTGDGEFSLERVACVGCCALAPVVVVDDKVEGKVTPTRVDGILLGFELRKSVDQTEEARGE